MLGCPKFGGLCDAVTAAIMLGGVSRYVSSNTYRCCISVRWLSVYNYYHHISGAEKGAVKCSGYIYYLLAGGRQHAGS